MANFNQDIVSVGLNSVSFEVPPGGAGPCYVEGHISLPTLSAGGGVSALVVTVNKNGGPVYVGQAGAEGFRVQLAVAALDVLQVVMSSGAAADQGLNVIKANISIGSGT
jgi:hypothetical protein